MINYLSQLRLMKTIRTVSLILILLGLMTKSSEAQNQSEKWDTYIAIYDEGKPGSTTLRMDLIERAPNTDYPIVLVTGVTYESNREDGFPDSETFGLLYKVSEELGEFLNKNVENVLVGTFMHNHERLEYFYVKSDKDLEKNLKKFYDLKFPKLKPYINIKEDKNWSYYREFLYPNEETRNYMADESVIRSLVDAGDKLEKPRRIDHWIYFKNEKELTFFKAEAIKQGFASEKIEKTDNDTTPFLLQIWREDKVDINTIYPITSSLKKLAKSYNGDYDGWETFVVKE
ncbi:DUF695 domain-containing protein [Pontibacter toksunensis]|uniref:DUF695 domain-containing protein n=1 Tax=Pontibacter toksunensis TaxID=1332631 RepID=A0ABW6BZD3_9BACT